MKHIFQKGSNENTLLMLHGTGGDEYSMIPLAKQIDPNANILSVLGNVNEHGMARFFKRLAVGVFDQQNLIEESHNLLSFVEEASLTYHFDLSHVVAIGYSNGANIATSIVLLHGKAFSKAILFHPMVPIRDAEIQNVNGLNVFIGAGQYDPLVKKSETQELVMLLQLRDAHVEIYWTNYGHQLTIDEIEAAKKWYERTK